MRRKIITLLFALLLCCTAVYAAEGETTGEPSAQALTLLAAELQDESGNPVVDGTAVYDPAKQYLVALHVDGTTESPAAEVYTVTYKKDGTAITGFPQNAGTYDITVEITESYRAEYAIGSASGYSVSMSLTIDKCPLVLTVTGDLSNRVYNGTGYQPTYTVDKEIVKVNETDSPIVTVHRYDSYDNSKWNYDLAQDEAPLNAGEYTLKYQLTGSYADNYYFFVEGGTGQSLTTFEWYSNLTVEPCPITLTPKETSFVYNGAAVIPEYSLTYGSDGTMEGVPAPALKVTFSTQNGSAPTDVGTYTVTYELVNKEADALEQPDSPGTDADRNNFGFRIPDSGIAVRTEVEMEITKFPVNFVTQETDYSFKYDGRDHFSEVFQATGVGGTAIPFDRLDKTASASPVYIACTLDDDETTMTIDQACFLPGYPTITFTLAGDAAGNYEFIEKIPTGEDTFFEEHTNTITRSVLMYNRVIDVDWALELPHTGEDLLEQFFQFSLFVDSSEDDPNAGEPEKLPYKVDGDDVNIELSLKQENGEYAVITELKEVGTHTVRLTIVGAQADRYEFPMGYGDHSEEYLEYTVEIYEVQNITVKVIDVPGTFTYTGQGVNPIQYMDFIMPADVDDDDIPVNIVYLEMDDQEEMIPFDIGTFQYKLELVEAYGDRYQLSVLTEEDAAPLTPDDFTGEFQITPAPISGSNFVDSRSDYIHGAGPYVAQLPELMYMADITARDRDALLGEELEPNGQSALLYFECTYSTLEGALLDGTPAAAGEYEVEIKLAGSLAYRYTLPENLTRRLSIQPSAGSAIQLAVNRAYSLSDGFWSVEGEPGGVTYYPGVTFYVNPQITDLLLTFIQANGG